MNAMSTGLSAYDVAGMASEVSALVGDADTATTVSFVTNDGVRGFDAARGTSTYGETSTSVSAFLSELTLEQAERVDMQLGAVAMLIRYADLATPPKTDDRFRAASVDYRVHRVVRGPLNTHWVIYAERVK